MAAPLRPYVVKQGDYLTKLAHTFGFDAEEVWNDPKNAELKQRRADMDVLAPGDVVYLPEASKEGLPLTPGTSNRYTAKVPKIEVTLAFQDGDAPLANEPCEVLGLGGVEGAAPGERYRSR
jgi:hypothetical protein